MIYAEDTSVPVDGKWSELETSGYNALYKFHFLLTYLLHGTVWP